RPAGTIFRSELVRATHDGRPGYLLAQLGPEPHRPHGRFQGWVITRVFPDDPALCANLCDLRVGDVILTVNGSPLERPEQLSKLVAALPHLDRLEVRSLRGGSMRTNVYPIIADPTP
ncbi:MAG: PDZ domain-containing protein, partial [Nannocystaceae bacterium]